jgi:hypothetical protein
MQAAVVDREVEMVVSTLTNSIERFGMLSKVCMYSE